jgi:hypothetical protein
MPYGQAAVGQKTSNHDLLICTFAVIFNTSLQTSCLSFYKWITVYAPCVSVSTEWQGCQIVYFQTKYPKSGHFWRVFQWKMFIYFMAIWSIFCPFWYILWHFSIYCSHLVYFPRLGILHQEKSGNPAWNWTESKGLSAVCVPINQK